jgi:isopenicillin N synthase-like dioxygenase
LVIKRFSDSIKLRGFAFVSLPPDLVSDIDQSVTEIKQFFDKSSELKSKFLKNPVFGYFDTTHKESFRFLTGQRLPEHRIPSTFKYIESVIHQADKIMFRLSLACAENLFPNIITQAKKHQIPLFDYQKPWGMFDITKYHNDGSRTRSGKTLNCEAHFDPGLLSLHLRSTEPGLQLQDENGKWINPPTDPKVGIIWAGDIATKINPLIRHGVHRVQTLGKPRIAIWHEICTEAQEHKELIETKKEVLSYDEGLTGIPTSKSMPPGMIYKEPATLANNIHIKTDYRTRTQKPSSGAKFMTMQMADGSFKKIELK